LKFGRLDPRLESAVAGAMVAAMTVADDIETLVARKHGLTEAQIAERLFGGDGYQQRVNSTCRRLIKQGRIERYGSGGPSEPYTYYPKGARPRA
jgi:hypothetical protein